MITCPNCSKQNADEAVHCGFCGHQLDGGNKPLKTMFGMGALDPELLKQAIADAKPQGPPAEEPGPPMPTSIPKLNLPKPGSDLPPLGLPKPGGDPFGATEAMPAVTKPNPSVGKADPFMDEFAALEAQFGHEFAPSKPPADEDDPNSPTEMHDTSALLAEADHERPSATPMFNAGVKPSSGDPFGPPSGDPFAAMGKPAGDPFGPPAGGPPSGDPFGPPSGPPPSTTKPANDPFAPPAGGPPKGAPPKGNLAPMTPGGGQIAKKDNTMLFIGAGVILLLGGLSCIALIVGTFFFGG